MKSDRKKGLAGEGAKAETLAGATLVAGPIIGGISAAAGQVLLERGGVYGYALACAAALFGVAWLSLAERGGWAKGAKPRGIQTEECSATDRLVSASGRPRRRRHGALTDRSAGR